MASATSARTLSTSLFGEYSRYKLVEFQSRWDWTEWMVEDAMTLCPQTGLPAIIRQAATREEAVAGLE